jgi:hypothetical protein
MGVLATDVDAAHVRGEIFEYVLQHVGVTFPDWSKQDMDIRHVSFRYIFIVIYNSAYLFTETQNAPKYT